MPIFRLARHGHLFLLQMENPAVLAAHRPLHDATYRHWAVHSGTALLDGDLVAFKSALNHLIMPSAVLALSAVALIVARVTRASMLEVLRQDYIRTAPMRRACDRAPLWCAMPCATR